MTLVIPNIFANDDIADATKINADFSACVASFNALEADLASGGTMTDSSAEGAGAITAFAGATAPTGWAICNGAELSKTTYAQLYARLGDTFATCVNTTTGSANSAPSSGNFRIPDLRSVFIRGVGTTNPDSVATTLGGYQADGTGVNGLSNPSTTGSSPNSHAQRYASAALSAGTWSVHVDQTGDGETSITGGSHTHTIGAPSSTDVETRPYNVGLNWIIRLYDAPFYAAWVANLMPNPLEDEGDIVYLDGTSTPTNLARGTEGQVLTATATTIGWADAAGGSGAPVGSIIYSSLRTAPDGYLVCDGRAVSCTTYAALKAVIDPINSGSTFNLPSILSPSAIWVGREFNSRDNLGLICNKENDMYSYAYEYNQGIYFRSRVSNTWVTLETGSWNGLCCAKNKDVYASKYGGDIYKQTAGTGSFVALSQTTRNWGAMGAHDNGNIYATDGDQLYMQTAGTGSFASLGQASRYWGNLVMDKDGNMWCGDASEYGSKKLYVQTGGTGNFAESTAWSAFNDKRIDYIAISPANDLAVLSYGRIFIWKNITGTPVEIASAPNNCKAICFDHSGKLFSGGSNYGQIFYYDNPNIGLSKFIKY